MIRTFISLLIPATLLAACSPAGTTGEASDGVNANFRCAAMIMAANDHVQAGDVDGGDWSIGAINLSMMTHLNSWAIPADIREKDAFAEVKAERDRLKETLDPPTILKRAKACIANTPKV